LPKISKTIIMETRKHNAAEKLQNGTHNCAQAIICTYAELAGINEKTARNLGNAFGSGMGTMEGTCGALVGAGIVLGLATKDRAAARKGMRQIMTQFQQRNGATQCKMLKGVGTGVVLRECTNCVADAAELLEEQLEA
jgi:C_GCAxxG_C_C family probable redox protein